MTAITIRNITFKPWKLYAGMWYRYVLGFNSVVVNHIRLDKDKQDNRIYIILYGDSKVDFLEQPLMDIFRDTHYKLSDLEQVKNDVDDYLLRLSETESFI